MPEGELVVQLYDGAIGPTRLAQAQVRTSASCLMHTATHDVAAMVSHTTVMVRVCAVISKPTQPHGSKSDTSSL